MEAEYRSVADTTAELLWVVSVLKDLGVQLSDCPKIWCDNTSVVVVSSNHVQHSKFKHVELNLFFVREKVVAGQLLVNGVPAYEQVVDVFTKPLSAPFHRHHLKFSVVPVEFTQMQASLVEVSDFENML